jgi:hypothetical protein
MIITIISMHIIIIIIRRNLMGFVLNKNIKKNCSIIINDQLKTIEVLMIILIFSLNHLSRKWLRIT